MTAGLCFAFTAWALLGVLCGINIGGSRSDVSAPAGIYVVVNALVCVACLVVLLLRGAGILP